MKNERSQEIEFIRSEIIGPSRNIFECSDKVSFDAPTRFTYPCELPGPGIPVFWRNDDAMPWQEIIHYKNETPLNSYGAGLLFPSGLRQSDLINGNNIQGLPNIDQILQEDEQEVIGITVQDDNDLQAELFTSEMAEGAEPSEVTDDDFDVISPDIFRPSTMGITFCIEGVGGELLISLPTSKLFFWQKKDDEPFQVNGRYEKCEKIIKSDGVLNNYPAWRRLPATTNPSLARIKISELQSGKKQSFNVFLPESSTLSLGIEIFPRKISDRWIITVVLRNSKNNDGLDSNESKIIHTLFQSYFEVRLVGSCFAPYPESVRAFEDFDTDEQSLALLYHDAATWAIGHGCASGWDAALGDVPECLYADVMPAVELPSMTPDIKDDRGDPISLSMRQLAELPEYDANNEAWHALESLLELYGNWIQLQIEKINNIDPRFREVADRHMHLCKKCHDRIKAGIGILKVDGRARSAFKLANKSMLLQQIASKRLDRRPLHWNGKWVAPEPINNGFHSPMDIFDKKAEQDVGSWRAFQIAFLLMSLDGLVNETDSDDRDIVDLIWFPTGGGKTEAYLGVAAFYMLYQRLLMDSKNTHDELRRDGTNVFMRYTLRMLTTQQFQRAASLICAMEYIRDKGPELKLGETRFSLGLWIGGEGSPNKCKEAIDRINKFKRNDIKGNPLVLTECPWCKSEIGKLESDPRRGARGQTQWSEICTAGFGAVNKNEPVVKCSDINCHFGGEYDNLPIEVIDERIYRNPPSMFIGTADKFAMLAYRPDAGGLFGRKHTENGDVILERRPPGLIIQDEFHLISGPLGTIYGVYEGVIEKLCSYENIKPKIIASTATIRGAAEQVKAIYAREDVQLFPSPALLMKDSFFGRYATYSDNTDTLSSGRLYFGIHAHGYGSFLTTQVRVFTAALFRSWFFADEKKDAWWTLLAFYNSLRELGGARTLFSSDISSRLKNYSFRYGCKNTQRYLNAVEELTSRKSQAELVQMMDRLTIEWNKRGALDVCLASNIIEVGVDIERLSLMAVVGQPKSTAQYIQVTGRVGRKWWERPGLILVMYNPSKSRDRSHFEQFHSYHRRLYERVEPTTATPFSVEAVERAMTGALLLWARQFYDAPLPGGYLEEYREYLELGCNILIERCQIIVQEPKEQERVKKAIKKVYDNLLVKWQKNPQMWEQYPQKDDGEYLMLWPGQFATEAQKKKGETIPSSMRNVDSNAYLQITDHYILKDQ